MTKDEYCINVCKAKCCYLRTPQGTIQCPHLQPDNRCGIYHDRFGPGSKEKEIVALYIIPPDGKNECPTVGQFWCWRIEQIIKHNLLPEEIKAQCCYAHPELLEVIHGTESPNPK